MSGSPSAIAVDGLGVRHDDLQAVVGVTFAVEAGEVVALLGPNGAGKTTTIETIEGFRRPDEGTVRVLDLDPVDHNRAVMSRTGVMLQEGGVPTGMRPLEALRLFASYYDHPLDPGQLLDRVGLADRTRVTWRRLSGGEKQRLSLALVLVGQPDVVLLDEPTSGVDVGGRQLIRTLIAELAERGCAVLLATHELDEAERMADRVVVMDRGVLVAQGTLDELGHQSGATSEVQFTARPNLDLASLSAALEVAVSEPEPGRYQISAPGTPTLVAELTRWLAEHDAALGDLQAGRHRLEDLFVRLTAPPEPIADASEVAEEPEEPDTSEAVFVSALVQRRAVVAQTRMELVLAARQGEQLLVSLGIPLGALVFFSQVDVLPSGDLTSIDFLAPGILALAIMGSAMVSLGIGAGFDRHYGVLKRLAVTPLGQGPWITAKTLTVAITAAIQVVVLSMAGLAVGWDPLPDALPTALVGLALGTIAFSGLGLLLAGTLPGLTNLAVTNAGYLVLVGFGGLAFPLEELPGPAADAARFLPSAALGTVIRDALAYGTTNGEALLILATWAVLLPLATLRYFRWT